MPDTLTPEAHAKLTGLTVAQLRATLADLPDDMPVIAYGEHGQNGESPVASVGLVWYTPESTWGGEVYEPAVEDAADYKPDLTRTVRAAFIEPIN